MKSYFFVCMVSLAATVNFSTVIAQDNDDRSSFEAYRNSDAYKEFWATENLLLSIRAKYAQPGATMLLRKLAKEPQLLDLLEMLPKQREDFLSSVNRLVDLDKNQNDASTAIPTSEYTKQRSNLIAELAKINMNFQSFEILSLEIQQQGIFKAISNSSLLRDHLEISASQEARLLKKSRDLADKLAGEIKQFRIDAAKILEEELKTEQKDKLASLYGKKSVNASISQLPIEQLIMGMTDDDRKTLQSQWNKIRAMVDIFTNKESGDRVKR